ncbi:MAG: SpoIID/LytB domain-containing protein, partial [Oscillospiraceae bacterium]
MNAFKINAVKVWIIFTLSLFLLLTYGVGFKLHRGESIFSPREIPVKTQAPIGKTPAMGDFFIILDETTGENLKVPAFQYVCGAVAAEMPPSFHKEALKAQALSAYTRALYLKKLWEEEENPPMGEAYFSQNPQKNQGFLYEENAKKLYGDKFPIYWSKIEEAAAYAMEREITFDGEPILAAYHAMSAGATESCDNVWQQ